MKPRKGANLRRLLLTLQKMKKIAEFITRYMAMLVLAAAVCSFLWPEVTGVVRTSWVTPLLGCVMFGMGLTLEL